MNKLIESAAPSPATPEAEGISGSSQCPICGKDTPHYHGPEAVEARNNIVRAITDQHLLCIKLADALRGMPFPPPMPDDAGNAMRDALKDFDDNSAAYMKAALASPPAAQCECPQHGTWLAAEDIYRMVRELDVAMNGDKAAKQASLCDIFEELKEYIEAAKADVVVPEIPYCAKCWKYGNQHSGECASYPTAAQPETDEKTLWDHPQRVVTERPPVSPELVEQFKGIAAEVAAAQEQKPVALDVAVGESLWLLEQTSNQDGKRRFWNGRGFGLDALNAARYPDKGAAEEVAWRLNGRNGQELGEPHGRVEVCGHMFQCGISPEVASPIPASGWVMVPEELLGMEFSVAQGDALRRTDPSGRLNLNSTAAWLVSGKVRNATKGRQLAEALTKLLSVAPGEKK